MPKPKKDGESAAELADWLKNRNRGKAYVDKISDKPDQIDLPDSEDKPGELDQFGEPFDDRDRKKSHRPRGRGRR